MYVVRDCMCVCVCLCVRLCLCLCVRVHFDMLIGCCNFMFVCTCGVKAALHPCQALVHVGVVPASLRLLRELLSEGTTFACHGV